MSCFAGCWWAQTQLRLQLVWTKSWGVWGVVRGQTSLGDFQGCSSTPGHPGQEGSCLTLTPESPHCREHRNYSKKCLDSALLSWWSGSGSSRGTEENVVTALPDTPAPRQDKLQGKPSLKALPISFQTTKNFAGDKYFHFLAPPSSQALTHLAHLRIAFNF